MFLVIDQAFFWVAKKRRVSQLQRASLDQLVDSMDLIVVAGGQKLRRRLFFRDSTRLRHEGEA